MFYEMFHRYERLQRLWDGNEDQEYVQNFVKPRGSALAKFSGENPSGKKKTNITLLIVLLEGEVQHRRRPPAVVLGERAPLFD